MIHLVADCGAAFLALAALALMGGFLLHPFRGGNVFFAAPLAGIAAQAIGVGGLYMTGHFPFWLAITLTLVSGSALTLWSLIARPRHNVAVLVAIMALSSMALVPLIASAAIVAHSPAVASEGTDQVNYAQTADWIRTHRIGDLLNQGPNDEAVPRNFIRNGPRFGAFSFLAFISWIRQEPGLFAYEDAAAVALIAGLIGFAGVYSQRPAMAFLLGFALLGSHWYDFSRTGFLGKLLGYPLSLTIIGLLILRKPTYLGTSALAFLAAGTAAVHSGFGVALMVASVAVPFLVLSAFWRQASLQSVVSVTLVIFSALSATGALTHWVVAAFPDWHLDWTYVVTRILDLDFQGGNVTTFSSDTVAWAAALSLTLSVCFLFIAIMKRQTACAALFGGPLILLLGLYLVDARATAFQLLGVSYPLTAAGILLLLQQTPLSRAVSIFGACAAVIFVALRAPHFWGATTRFLADNQFLYSQAMFDGLSHLSEQEPIMVDTANRQTAFFMREESERLGGIRLAWREQSWKNNGSRLPFAGGPTVACLHLWHVSDAPVDEKIVWTSSSMVVTRCTK